MSNLKIGDTAPDFSLPSNNEETVSLSNFENQWKIIYFYPKDNTPGCTTEAIDFSYHIDKFNQLNTVVLGISADSIKSHCNFINKKGLKITLLSDPEKTAIQKYGAWQLKKMYGKEYYGIVRSTFLIDPANQIKEIWPKVKVKGHVEEVLQKLNELK